MSSKSIPRAWVRLLRAHAALSRSMDANLRAAHGLSLREYEVLLALFEAPGGRLRRVDLAAMVLLTQGGVTRLLASLERAGLVASAASDQDRRVTFAELTAAGRERFVAAARSHRRDIDELFAAHFDAAELDTLDGLLGRLPGAEDDPSWAGPAGSPAPHGSRAAG